jgi:glycerophosphoryl diester phosphodiesterase
VSARRVRDLKRLDAGGWRDGRFLGQRIQTLQEVLERFRDRARFWVELKAGSRVYPGIEERVVSTLEIYDVVDRALIQSFDHDAIDRTRSLSREVRLGVLVEEAPVQAALLAPGGANAICPGQDLVTEGLLAKIREAGLECYVWTVNEPARMDRLVSWQVSGIITDRPGVLSARLGR